MATNTLPPIQDIPKEESFSSIIDGHVDSHAKVARDEERKTLARKEGKAVRNWRIAVFAVLVSTAALVSTSCFLYMKNDQDDDFKQEFKSLANKLLESYYHTVERKLEALDALSVAYSSYAHDTGATWPNVTLPDIEVRGAGVRVLSETAVINFYPLVTDETREGWEAYQIANRDYFDEAFASGVYQRENQDALFNNTSNEQRQLQQVELRDEIENLNLTDGSNFVAPPGSGPYLPVWQISPVVPIKSLLNFNILTHPAAGESYRNVIDSGKAILNEAQNLNQENLGDTGVYFRLLLSLSQYRYDIDEFLGDPTSSLAYPVFDTFIHETRKVVGVLGTNVYWKLNFERILPQTAKGVMCVIENTQGQKFTYRVDGSDAVYAGNGDLHDRKYDAMGEHGKISTYMASRTSPVISSYTSVPLDLDYLDYTLHVYPSSDTESQYKNNYPVIAFIVVACVFLFTSLVFIFYDCYVGRRQRIVMNRAIASSASKYKSNRALFHIQRSDITNILLDPCSQLCLRCFLPRSGTRSTKKTKRSRRLGALMNPRSRPSWAPPNRARDRLRKSSRILRFFLRTLLDLHSGARLATPSKSLSSSKRFTAPLVSTDATFSAANIFDPANT